MDGSTDLYRYDIAVDTWTTLPDALPLTFGGFDDITFGVVLPDDPVLHIGDYDTSHVELYWDSLDTHKYRLWESDDLVIWNVAEDWQDGTGARMSVLKPKTGVTRKFYKLERQTL